MKDSTLTLLKALSIRNLFVLHDKDFNILEVYNGDIDRMGLIEKEILAAGNLKKLYAIHQAPTEGFQVSAIESEPFQWPIQPFALHTLLPQTSLVSYKIGDVYIARITAREIMPNIASDLSLQYFFADNEKDTLLGFSGNFHKIFETTRETPEGLLGRPLHELLSPTPAELHLRNMAVSLPDLQNRGAPAFDWSFDKMKALDPGIEIPIPQKIRPEPEGLYWKSDSSEPVWWGLGFMTLPPRVDTFSEDFSLEVTVTLLSGTPPLLILGGRYLDINHHPDHEGYLFGPNQTGTHIQLKREGFVWSSTRSPELPPDAPLTLGLHKNGRRLIFEINGKRVLAHHDANFFFSKDARLSLALRQGSACRLHAIRLRKGRPALARPEEEEAIIVVSTRTRPPRHFILEQFSSIELSLSLFAHVACYFLHDITDLQQRIDTLGRQYRSQKKREKNLLGLINRYESKGTPFLGRSAPIARVRSTARAAAASGATILIQGPTGSGKEVLAAFIHQNSPRRDKPFIKVDCATLPRPLIESLLFGHEKGAFTGAHARSIGLFEQADGGTIFLDEVGNLPLDIQSKLLHFFNDFMIRRVGGAEAVRLDIRCIAASNLRLESLVRSGAFREDLYYRLNTIEITIPPLCERREDIPELANHFLQVSALSNNKETGEFTRAAMDLLLAHDWPGNVRELKNTVEQAVVFGEKGAVTPDLIRLGADSGAEKPRKPFPRFRLKKTEPGQIEEVLRRHQGRIREVLETLGISRTAFYQYVRDKKIDLDAFRAGYQA